MAIKPRNLPIALMLTGTLCFYWNMAQAQGLAVGDVSGDGQITLYDASLVLRYVEGLTALTSDQLTRADVEGNGNITAEDANLIAQYVLGLITQFPAAASYTVTTPQGLSVTLTPSGIQALSLKGISLLVSPGTWSEANASDYITECGDFQVSLPSGACQNGPPYPAYPNEIYLDSTQVKQSIVQSGANSFVVTHTYPNAVFTYTYTINGEDIVISTVVENTSSNSSFYNLRFEGLNLNFDSSLENPAMVSAGLQVLSWCNIFWQYYNYIQIGGVGLFHPSTASDLGAWYMRNNYVGVGFNPLNAFDQPNFLWDSYFKADQGVSEPSRHPTYFVHQSIGPGQSATVTVDMRISNNVDLKHLLQPYQQNYNQQYPSAQYQPDYRPIAFTDEGDPSFVSPSDPYGFYSYERWDIPSVMQQWLAAGPAYFPAAGIQGMIHWMPQGERPVMFTPAFDQFPSVIWNNFANIMLPYYANEGVKFGLESRPSIDVTDPSDTTACSVNAQDFSSDCSSLSVMGARFTNAINNLGARLFYEDSFTLNYNDTLIERYIRSQINATGYNVLTFTEEGNDLSLPFSGLFREEQVTNGQISLSWMDSQNEQLALYEWLMPPMMVAAWGNSSLGDTASFQWAYAHKVTPLVFAGTIQSDVNILATLNTQYLDPVTHQWNPAMFPAPAVPANFTATESSPTQVSLSWTQDSGDLISYQIQRSTDGGNTWQTLVTLMQSQTNFTPAYTDISLAPRHTYTYRIQAISDFNGYSSYSNSVSVSL